MATWPSGKAKVCNTYITSSNLVVASLKPLIFKGFFVVLMYVNVCKHLIDLTKCLYVVAFTFIVVNNIFNVMTCHS